MSGLSIFDQMGGDGSTYEQDLAATLLRYPLETDGLLKRLQALLPETRPLGRDVSIYQGAYSVKAAAACGARLWYFRAGVSWGAPDSSFPGNYASAAGKPRTSYHVLYPDQPVVKQADQVWYAQHPEIDKVPRVIDLEVDRGVSAAQIADRTWEMSELVLSRDGLRPMIYSRYLLVNAWLASWTTAMLNAHYYLLAQYLYDRAVEHPGPPTTPNRVDPARVIWHQTADKKPGCEGEAESTAVDYNRWTLGDEAAMDKFMLDKWGFGAPPPVPPPGEKVGKIKQPVNFRAYPVVVDCTKQRVMAAGELVTIIGERDGFCGQDWWKVKDTDGVSGWVAKPFVEVL